MISTKRWTGARKCTIHGQPCFCKKWYFFVIHVERLVDLQKHFRISSTLLDARGWTSTRWLPVYHFHVQSNHHKPCGEGANFHHTIQAYLPDDTFKSSTLSWRVIWRYSCIGSFWTYPLFACSISHFVTCYVFLYCAALYRWQWPSVSKYIHLKLIYLQT